MKNLKITGSKIILLVLIFISLFALVSISYALEEAKERSQIPDNYKWNLELIYPNNEKWQQDVDKCEQLLKKMQNYKGKLGSDSETLLSALKLAVEINIIKDNIAVYAKMRADEDTRDNFYQGMKSKAETLESKIETALSFIEPEILAIPEEKIKLFFEKNKGLDEFSFYLKRVQHLKPHILSEKEEAIIASTGDVASGITNIYTVLTCADMDYPLVKDETGKDVRLSYGIFLKSLENPNREIRKTVYKAFYDTYGKYLNTIAANLCTKLKSDWFYARVAKYDTTLEASLDANNIPVSVYDNLIKTVNDNLNTVHRYYALRKKLSGLADYSVYDNYYNIIPDPQSKITYEEAQGIIKKALEPLGEDYLKIIQKAFDERWVDVYENKGKRTGAYSWGTYTSAPFILMNFDDNLSSTLTLAHELGHSAHSFLTFANQPYIYSDSSIFLAEIASTFNEHLVLEYLIKNSKNKKEKLSLIMKYLNDAIGTLFRQTMFAEYEKEIHTRIEKGESLTKDDINKYYMSLCKKYYGADVKIDEVNSYEWSRVPHFFKYNYYVYQYATCFAASTYFSEKVLKEGKPARDKYLELLKAGGSDYPIDSLKKAGLDMSKPESILSAVRLFERLLSEAEQIVESGY